MKKYLLCLFLFFSSVASIAAPVIEDGNDDNGNIIFYNNTNTVVTVGPSIVSQGIETCPKSPYRSCIQLGSDIILQPYSSQTYQLLSAVTDNNIHYGAFGFSISVAADENVMDDVELPVMVTPTSVFFPINFDFSPYRKGHGDAATSGFEFGSTALPQYTVSVVQGRKLHQDGSYDDIAHREAISINPLSYPSVQPQN